MNITFGLLLFAMFYAPQKPLVFTAPHNPVPVEVVAKVAQIAPKQATVYRPGVDPHGTDELEPSDIDASDVPYGVPLIKICYKDELGDWVVGVTTLYSGNADTKFEDSADRYEYKGACPR